MKNVPALCICASFNRTQIISDIIGTDIFPDHFLCSKDAATEFAEVKASGRPVVLVVLGPLGYSGIKLLTDDYDKPQSERRVKWIHSCSAGLDWYRFGELQKEIQGIPITTGKGGYNALLAQHVVYSILYFARQTAHQQRNRAAKKWDPFELEETRGLQVGILGYGEIGRETAKMLQPMYMDVTGVKRNQSAETEDEYGAKLVSGDEERDRVIRESDIVVNILPATPETEGMFDLERFKTMKRSAIYINIGRGATQVDNELAEAISTGVIAGASLDVFQQEPLPLASPLWDIDDDKILLTSHNACLTEKSFRDTIGLFTKYAKEYMTTGKLNAYLADAKLGY
ncbi:putative D-isomer specific 2-hydroxyacid dehydrogenase-protein [Leptomonas pyrrhocoris]|uniref:Putative D-isomer specific 2-hydroxyacid dehydrogenase-protein n=1 Tax=Leptomonas pyrrhocoris TaxID=157538 RepID=A0A0N0DWU7_LEPPY|nr:putative D-isomer specific 2-hydroxyacid dehydrogenase-protein [Leptomonas pyrrhocoris]XP_015660650.1 putative D-isomer specific 2-hydroxyacid dehydrogenase-protein [Leptomonas pyrrhocoris]KPA82210.1 putative D-isomer specific 2-hydroxyacid dehydrogenase-protein [Leptomonas pyrrhocoris]KPA82211.1 putative D-isomer specific 2-hydroxyacid dehydrogenase-protein [Leptomonas pyrrhocoris]|eukprot:XP_015660649.1 putative D-isomer specific 2-hydroxyacid dehydrogenase-protein [Leptomonas pyrrhocoris]